MNLFLILFLNLISSTSFLSASEKCLFDQEIKTTSLNQVNLQVCKTIPGYNSLLLKMIWKLNDHNEIKRVNFIFAPNRRLPKKIKYLTVQNQEDQLVDLTLQERKFISDLADKIDKNSEFYDYIIDFINLFVNTITVDENYFKSQQDINFYADDGIIWSAGWFTAHNTLNYAITPVADDLTNCFGRKGSQCGQPHFSREALNHDLCHRIMGQNLGVCNDEFWDAAFAPTSQDPLLVFF